MTGFSSDWLALREPFDDAARSAAWNGIDLAAQAVGWRGGAPALRVVDLACGSGANLRELAPRLKGAQHWTLADHDPALLAAIPQALSAWADGAGCRLQQDAGALRLDGEGWYAEIELLACDLATGLARVPLAAAHLVTASALLDLVSAAWLDNLLDACPAVPALLFALSVDGRIAWAPQDEDDACVDGLFAAHQRRDKGFGPALGPAAPALAAQLFEARGRAVRSTRTDWLLRRGSDAPQETQLDAMKRALIEGMAAAACEADVSARTRIEAWRARRLALVATTSLRVGHVDVLATRADA